MMHFSFEIFLTAEIPKISEEKHFVLCGAKSRSTRLPCRQPAKMDHVDHVKTNQSVLKTLERLFKIKQSELTIPSRF